VLRKGEEILVKLAKEADPDAVHQACDYIQRLVHEDDDPHDPDGSAATFAKRQGTLSRLGELWRLARPRGAATGGYLQTGLQALTPPPGEGDERSAAQRRHDALAEWARDTLREGRTPTTGGVRPQIGVLLPLWMLLEIYGIHRHPWPGQPPQHKP